MKVNILGTEYTIKYKTDEEVAKDIGDNIGECGGYCNAYNKTIVIAKQDTSNDTEEIKKAVERRDLRHEIIHAFLHESGVFENSIAVENWAMNEEMVDWIALQFPKMLKAFEEVGAIETIGEEADIEEVTCLSGEKCYIKDEIQPTQADIDNAIKTIEKLNEQGECLSVEGIKADKPSGKVYIATLKIKDKGNIARTNGGIFTTKEKAVESIKKRGFALLSPYGDYRNPKDLKCIAHFHNVKEWMYYLEKRSHNEPTSELYKNMWLETVGYKEDISYRIEEHCIDLEE